MKVVKSARKIAVTGALAFGAMAGGLVQAHAPVDGVHGAAAEAAGSFDAESLAAAVTVSGQGDAKFAWDQELTAMFPEEARPFEPKMHGGFHEDANTGIVYTGIPGYGLCSISSDLKTWTRLGDDKRLKDNIHNLAVFTHKDETFIALAQNTAQRLLITDLQGNVKQAISKPTAADELGFDAAQDYYKANGAFNVTGVTYLDGRLYAVTGYSKGDFVLTLTEEDGTWKWAPLAWGGKGRKPGQFITSHGVSAYDDMIYVANRDAGQVVTFTKDGKLIEVLPGLPPRSRVCGVAKYDDTLVLSPLMPVLKGQASSPIYAYRDKAVVSTILSSEIGVPGIRHNHHVWAHYHTDADGKKQLYLLLHGWNRGKYVVLKHVAE